jgi:mRNA interferase MazF
MVQLQPSAKILRGEVWWVALDPAFGSEIAKTRPCVVVTHDVVSENRRTVVIVPLSTARKGRPPIAVPVMCAGEPARAVIDQVRAVDKGRLLSPMVKLTNEEMRAIDQALLKVLDLS